MVIRKHLAGALFAPCIMFSFMGITLAQGLPVAVVAVIDYTKVLKNAEAAKGVGSQIRKYRNEFSREVRTEELRLREAEAKLKRERSRLSFEEFNKRQQVFRNQVLVAQKRGQDRKRQLDRALKNAMREIQGVVIPLVQEVTKAGGYTLVVDKSQVLFANRALEITDEVLLKLNQKLRTVVVPKPE